MHVTATNKTRPACTCLLIDQAYLVQIPLCQIYIAFLVLLLKLHADSQSPVTHKCCNSVSHQNSISAKCLLTHANSCRLDCQLTACCWSPSTALMYWSET